MATAWEKFDEDIRRVTCVRHPKGSKEFHYCIDCSRVFCGDCRKTAVDRVNHKTHFTVPVQTVLNDRMQWMTETRKIISDYSIKHDMLLSALLKLEDKQKNQTEKLNGIIDDFALQLHREVENLRTKTIATIAMRASEIYSSNPEEINRKKIDTELQKMREVRAAIEHEVRLCERDELYLVEKNRDLESFATELSEFQSKTLEIPDTTCYDLTDLQHALMNGMSLLKCELKCAKDAFVKALEEFIAFPNPNHLSVLTDEVITFPKEKLTSSSDTNESPMFRGAIPAGDNSEAMYFVDWNNSKIKMLDLKANKIFELFSGPSGALLTGLANVDENVNGQLIATTEHTRGTPATVRVLFLRRNSGANATGRLDVVQSVTLNSDVIDDWTSIAPFAGGNVFCAVRHSRSLHELCRLTDASPAAVFESTARTHRLPEAVYSVCSLQSKSNGEWRLAASFEDNKLRVFGVVGGTLSELQRVPQPHAKWCPRTLVAPPNGSLIVQSQFLDSSNTKLSYCIECCAAQPDGSLAAPKRLHSQETGFYLIGLLMPTHSFPTFRLVVNGWQRSEISLYPIAAKAK